MYVTYIKNYTYNNKNIIILKRSLFKKSKNILSIFFRMISFSIIYRFDLKATSCSFFLIIFIIIIVTNIRIILYVL